MALNSLEWAWATLKGFFLNRRDAEAQRIRQNEQNDPAGRQDDGGQRTRLCLASAGQADMRCLNQSGLTSAATLKLAYK